MSIPANYNAQSEIRTYVEVLHGAKVLFHNAKENQEGSFYTTMSALLLAAFAFEAYLNHVGEALFDREAWKEVEALRVQDKLARIAEKIGKTPDHSRRPFQSLVPLFRFRNSIAHGKSQILVQEKIVPKETDPKSGFPQPKWEEYCTIENAERAIEDVEAILEWIHPHTGLEHHVFMSGMSVATLKYEESFPITKSGDAPEAQQ